MDDSFRKRRDTIWFEPNGGRSFLNALAEDNRLSIKSLATLKGLLQKRNLHPMVIIGHTGWLCWYSNGK